MWSVHLPESPFMPLDDESFFYRRIEHDNGGEKKDSGMKNGLTNLAEAPDKHGNFRVVYLRYYEDIYL